MSWRDHLKIHPAAELFPLMSEPELRELGEDIKANGLVSSIVLYEDKLLDGRNRLDAMELVGIKFRIEEDKYKLSRLRACDGSGISKGLADLVEHCNGDPYNFVLSANLHRRHLTDEQRRQLIAKIIKAKPEASDRTIAKQVKRDHKTVAKIRKKLESTGEVSPVEKRIGADGKQRKSRAKKKPTPASSIDKLFEGAAPGRVTESAEVSAEERRAEMARLDEPAEIDEVDKRLNCVFKTIERHVEGLSRTDTDRFIRGLRELIDHIERTS